MRYSIAGATKNWIAVEGSTSYYATTATTTTATSNTDDQELNQKIASSAPRGPQTCEERNVFAIYVSYYVKVKLTLSGMGGEVSLKLPFILGHVDDEECTGNALVKSDTQSCNALQSTRCEIKPGADVTTVDIDKNPIAIEQSNNKLEALPALDRARGSNDIIKVSVHENSIDEQSDSKQIEEKFRSAKLVESHTVMTEEEDVTICNVITAQIHHHQQQLKPSTAMCDENNRTIHENANALKENS